MKPYLAPQVADFGRIADVTAWFGNPSVSDVLIDTAGNVIQTGENSIDGCLIPEGWECTFPVPTPP